MRLTPRVHAPELTQRPLLKLPGLCLRAFPRLSPPLSQLLSSADTAKDARKNCVFAGTPEVCKATVKRPRSRGHHGEIRLANENPRGGALGASGSVVFLGWGVFRDRVCIVSGSLWQRGRGMRDPSALVGSGERGSDGGTWVLCRGCCRGRRDRSCEGAGACALSAGCAPGRGSGSSRLRLPA
jgi:hypothetical protein